MKIIDKVEINYFRSAYALNITQCDHVNIITGGNDAGKSNILKALNLFFNNQTDGHSDFDFEFDLSKDREREARTSKGRMSIWIKVTFCNYLNWKSLPERFSVKRTWNRYSDAWSESVDEDIPATTMGRFLSRVQYKYIPAIRGGDVFSDLLAELHDTLYGDESTNLRRSSDMLIGDLRKLTESMSDNLDARIGIKSKISLPDSLEELFRSLSFSTRSGDHDIGLVFRGDGIQSRHLPFILEFLANRSKKDLIWGYEEPETSLELSKSFEMAEDFRDRFTKSAQIFITTHSPAFYDIDGSHVKKWHAEPTYDNNIRSTKLTPLNSTHDVDESLGLLHIITPRVAEAAKKEKELKQSLESMKELLAEQDYPLVYVEGQTDVEILGLAHSSINIPDERIIFRSADGADNITQFLKNYPRLKSESRPIFGLYDSDAKGRKEYAKFQNYHLVDNTNVRIIDSRKRVYALTLIPPQHIDPVNVIFRRLKLSVPIPVEFMFDSGLIDEAIKQEVLRLTPRISRVISDELPLEVNISEGIADKLAADKRYLTMEIDDACKKGFVEWLKQQDKECFEVFRPTLSALSEAIKHGRPATSPS